MFTGHLVFLYVHFLIHCLAMYCYLLFFFFLSLTDMEIFVNSGQQNHLVCVLQKNCFLSVACPFVYSILCFINKNKCKSLVLIVSKLTFSFMTCVFSFYRMYSFKVFSFVQSIFQMFLLNTHFLFLFKRLVSSLQWLLVRDGCFVVVNIKMPKYLFKMILNFIHHE